MKQNKFEKQEVEFEERVVGIKRVTKVVKGGRRFRFSALVIVGNKQGQVGFGTGKAQEVPDAIKKAVEAAKNNLITVPVIGTSIPHGVVGQFGAGKVFFKPASEGTGIIAGGAVRVIFELAGINDVLSKSIGSSTPINQVRATFNGLELLKTKEDVAKLRGVEVERLA